MFSILLLKQKEIQNKAVRIMRKIKKNAVRERDGCYP